MLTLALASTLLRSSRAHAPSERMVAAEGPLDKLVRWTREQIRYRRALHELRRLDHADLDDLNLARVDLPELAWRHARGAEPLAQPVLAPAA
jgi:uncharacterized protein YjiS (DUF1127 family)